MKSLSFLKTSFSASGSEFTDALDVCKQWIARFRSASFPSQFLSTLEEDTRFLLSKRCIILQLNGAENEI